MKKINPLFWISLGAAVLMSGCTLMEMVRETYVPLVGSWKLKDSSQGSMTVTFSKNQAYEVDTDGNGTKDIWGQYKVTFNNQITFRDEGGDIGRDCFQEGIYSYKISGGELQYTLIGDQCADRIKALNMTWVRIIAQPRKTTK